METIHKISEIKRRATKVSLMPNRDSSEIILKTLKSHLHTLKESPVSFMPNAPKNLMWEYKHFSF